MKSRAKGTLWIWRGWALGADVARFKLTPQSGPCSTTRTNTEHLFIPSLNIVLPSGADLGYVCWECSNPFAKYTRSWTFMSRSSKPIKLSLPTLENTQYFHQAVLFVLCAPCSAGSSTRRWVSTSTPSRLPNRVENSDTVYQNSILPSVFVGVIRTSSDIVLGWVGIYR